VNFMDIPATPAGAGPINGPALEPSAEIEAGEPIGEDPRGAITPGKRGGRVQQSHQNHIQRKISHIFLLSSTRSCCTMLCCTV
jgi:hypothetical protein